MNWATAMTEARGRPWLAELDPRLKVGWVLTISLLCVVLDRAPLLIALVVLAAIPFCGLSMRWPAWRALLFVLLASVWSVTLSQALFYQGNTGQVLWPLVPSIDLGIWTFPGLNVYREGIWHGLLQSTRFVSLALAGLTLALSTSPERLLSTLAQLRVPPAACFMTSVALRAAPIALAEFAATRAARVSRGDRRFRWRSPQTWGGAVGGILGSLEATMASGLRRVTTLSESVTVRGFDPRAERTNYPESRLRPFEKWLAGVLFAVASLTSGAKTLYWLQIAGYPRIGSWSPFIQSLGDWL